MLSKSVRIAHVTGPFISDLHRSIQRFMKHRTSEEVAAELLQDNGMLLSRRQFVQGLAMGGAVASFGIASKSVFAAAIQQQQPDILSGTQFNLTIGGSLLPITVN